MSCKVPAGTVLPLDEGRGLGAIFGDHIRTVPLDFLADAQGNAAEEHDFHQLCADVKTGVANFRLVLPDGREPFLRMAGMTVVSIFVARNALGKLRHRGMISVKDEFLLV